MSAQRLIPLCAALLALSFVATAGAAKPRAAAKHARATTVTATEVEWHVSLSRTSMPAGSVTFTVRDSGHLAHSFVVLRTNLPAGKLPMKGNQVDIKKAGTLAGQITDIKPGKTAHLSLTLKAGSYVLFCNLPAHYKSGQYAAFRVT